MQGLVPSFAQCLVALHLVLLGFHLGCKRKGSLEPWDVIFNAEPSDESG